MNISSKVDFSSVTIEKVPISHNRQIISKALIVASIAVIFLLSSVSAMLIFNGYNIGDILQSVFSEKDDALLQEEFDRGEWVYLNGTNIAMIIPDSPQR